MKTYKKNFPKENREAAKEELSAGSKVPTEYVVNQTIIWIVIVFLSVMMARKFF